MQEEPQRPVNTELLKSHFYSMLERNEFEHGQLIEWKEGLKNKKVTSPVIVTEVLNNPIYSNEKDTGSIYFNEPLDLKIGALDGGDYIELYVDSRRFQPIK